MASDHQYNHSGSMKFKGAHKMMVLEKEVAQAFFNADKAIVGFAGNTNEIGPVFSWLANPEGKPPRCKGTELIVLTSNKEIYTNYNLGPWCYVDKPYYSIGSGSHFALGTLAAGKSPSKAVEIASEHDIHSGFGVTEIKL